MERRGFMFSVLAFLGAGKLFAKQKPFVVKFNEKGHIANVDEVFEGISFEFTEGDIEHGGLYAKAMRTRKVWVNQGDAIEYGLTLFWGELNCEQHLGQTQCTQPVLRPYYYGNIILKPTENSMRFKPNRCLTPNTEQFADEVINKCRKENSHA